MIRAVLLDFFGTVVDEADESIAEICALVARQAVVVDRVVQAGVVQPGVVHGAVTADRVTPAQVDAAWGETYRDETVGRCGPTFQTLRAATEASLLTVMERFGVPGGVVRAAELCGIQAAYWRRPTLVPEARAFLAALAVPVCIVSNVDTADLHAALDYLGLSFQHVVTSEDERAYKPDGRMFAAALTRLGVAPDEVLHVGDSLSADVGGGAAAGLATAWVNRTGKVNPGPHRPDYQVGELTELLRPGMPLQYANSI